MAYGQQYYGSRFERGVFLSNVLLEFLRAQMKTRWPVGTADLPSPEQLRERPRVGQDAASVRWAAPRDASGERGERSGAKGSGRTPTEGRILCASSLGCAPGAVLAWVLGLRGFAAVSLLQVGLSVNYWRRPEWGLRRNLDIGCALLLALAVFFHWSSEAKCAYSSAARLGYTACFLAWCRATSAWAAERPSWVWWHACFHALIGSVNLVLACGCGLRLSGVGV